MVAAFSKSYSKVWVGFCLIGQSLGWEGFILKPTEKAQVLLKNRTMHFKKRLRLRDWNVLL